MSGPPISKLPLELLDRIFEVIPPTGRPHGVDIADGHSLLCCALVCKRWEATALRRLYLTIRVRNFSLFDADDIINALQAIGPQVRTIVFEPSGRNGEDVPGDCASLATDVLFACLALTPNVQHVSIESPSNVCNADFEAILACLGMLKRLRILEWRRIFLPHLRRMRLDINTIFTMAHIHRAVQCMPSLSEIYLAPIVHPVFTSKPLPQWHRLTSMVLEETSLHDAELYNLLCNQPQLQRLDINFDSLTQGGIAAALECVKHTLVSLRLSGWVKRAGNNSKRAIQTTLSEFPALRSLHTSLHQRAFNAAALAHPPPCLRRWLSWDILTGVGPECLASFILSLDRQAYGEKIDFVFSIDPSLWTMDENAESVNSLVDICSGRGLALTITEGDVTIRER